MSSSHTLDAIEVIFDDPRFVADAGLIQPATLAQHLGLRDLFDRHVDLGATAGRANVGDKAMTVIHSALAGGDSIDDCDALRAGATRSVLGHTVLAPSTVGRSCAASRGVMPASWTRSPVSCSGGHGGLWPGLATCR